ncbi:MAG: hypothetical protein ABSH25_20565 [Syntrophorhabdales bacterium]
MSIRPGAIVLLVVVDIDLRTERIDVRDSTVFDVDGERLVLAQTQPAIKDSTLRKEITVTYLEEEKDGPVRYGFPAVVTGFTGYDDLMLRRKVGAVAVRKRGDPIPYDLRRYYRVVPTSSSDLTMSIHAKRVNVIDISLGGVRFTYDADGLELCANSVVEVGLDIGGVIRRIDATILRTWKGKDKGLQKDLSFAAADFVNLTRIFDQELSLKIREIEREDFADERPTHPSDPGIERAG